MTKKEKVVEILRRLSRLFPDPKSALVHSSAWELLVATLLSAQTTDKLVNTVTPALFRKYPSISDMANAPLEEIDALLRKVNYHRTKAKNIQSTAKILVQTFRAEVPRTMEELITLPGVGRKTANVVLGDAFGISVGIVVDTHVIRLSTKLGLTQETDPVKIEQDLMKIVPQERWRDFSHLLVLTGRAYCPARGHDAAACPIHDLFVST